MKSEKVKGIKLHLKFVYFDFAKNSIIGEGGGEDKVPTAGKPFDNTDTRGCSKREEKMGSFKLFSSADLSVS